MQIETELNELRESADKLNEIVEGIRNKRWAADGMRLKDTPEWCAFYCALKRAAESANAGAQRPE